MVRKRSTSVGKIKPYIDVKSMKDIPKFESLISTGPITVVLVYAGWCGHCQRLKDKMWDKMATSPNRGVNTAAVHYDMVGNTSLKNAPIEGYPTIFEVKASPKENVSTAIPTPQNEKEMAEVLNMNNAGNISEKNEDKNNLNGEVLPVSNTINMNATNEVQNVKNNNKNVSKNTVNMNLANTNEVEQLNESMNINAGNNVPANQMNSYKPTETTELDTLPPDVASDTYKDAISTVVKSQTMKGGNLMESLLKIAADSAHAVVLAGSAAEISQRMKKRKAQKSRKHRHSHGNTRKHKKVMKKKTRKNYRNH